MSVVEKDVKRRKQYKKSMYTPFFFCRREIMRKIFYFTVSFVKHYVLVNGLRTTMFISGSELSMLMDVQSVD